MPPRASIVRERLARRVIARLVRGEDNHGPCIVCYETPEKNSTVTCTICEGIYTFCENCISKCYRRGLKCLYCIKNVTYRPQLTLLMVHSEQREQEERHQQRTTNSSRAYGCRNCMMINRDNAGTSGYVPINVRGHNVRTCPRLRRRQPEVEEGMLYIIWLSIVYK